MKTLAFFSNKRGVGTTTLVHHLAWMLQELGVNTIAADLDPQANLTEAFLPREDLQNLWLRRDGPETILGALQPLFDGSGDIEHPVLQEIGQHLALLPGHLGLSLYEGCFEDAWRRDLDSPDALRLITAFYRALERAAREQRAELVLLDLGPSLGALNRTAFVTSDFVILILGADFYSLQGLHNLGLAFVRWRKDWEKRLGEAMPEDLLPSRMVHAGYVMLRHSASARSMGLVQSSWGERIPAIYHQEILGKSEGFPLPGPDFHQLAILKHYPGLMLLAQDARKPMFLLKPADGAIGGYSEAVLDCYRDFKALATRIAAACGVAIPASSNELP